MSSIAEKQRRIRTLLQERNGILLVHYYQRGDVQDIADFLGDSLALSMKAAATDADLIVFAGVQFMAESASILSPEKKVLLPRLDAGCPLADMITAKELQELQARYPGSTTVTYVNSSAEVKAASDICCTSSNAVKVVESIKGDGSIIMVPDGNLARYTAKKTGKNIIPWEGSCPVHDDLRVESVHALKEKYPRAVFAAHPECRAEVLAEADFVGSTSGILDYAAAVNADTVIVGTEQGIFHQLEKRNPEKTFIPASEKMVCHTMKYTTLDDILLSLEKGIHVVSVDDMVRAGAKKALDRMLVLS